MKRFIKQTGLFLVPVLIGMICLFIIPVNKQFSYWFVKGECNNKANWIYNRVFFLEQETDVIFIGASQTACAVMDQRIEQDLQDFTGKPIYAANMGYCRGGRDIQYVMLKEIFRQKKPSVVVIEVTEDEPKKSHPVFPYLADTGDLFGSFVFFNQRYFQSLFKGLTLRFEYLKWILAGKSVPSTENVPLHSYIHNTVVASPGLIQQNRLNWEKRFRRHKNGLIRNIELRYSKHYLSKMVGLANENGCKPVFLYLRESGSRLNQPLLFDYYKSIADVILLPDPIFSDPENWSDATHLNDNGAIKASVCISSELLPYINHLY